MSKHRHSTHLSLLVGFLMMAASAAAGQTTVGAGQSTAGAGQSTAGAGPSTAAAGPPTAGAGQSNTAGSPFDTTFGPFNTAGSPFDTTSGPFNTTFGPFTAGAGQIKTAKPGEPVERQLSGDQKLREWSLDANVGDDIKRIKVCRVEDVCKMRFKEGETPRMRVRNLVVPLRYEDENIAVSEAFTRQVQQTLDTLRDKRGLTVRFIGYTDNAPLTGRDEQTYGNDVSLSKARAQRIALAMQEKLGLPVSAIESDGRGATRPVASNESVQGRALNRRVEVEFWYDDPLQALSDEPQLCPDDVEEMVTRVYEPAWGTIATPELANGQPTIPPGDAAA